MISNFLLKLSEKDLIYIYTKISKIHYSLKNDLLKLPLNEYIKHNSLLEKRCMTIGKLRQILRKIIINM